MIIHHALDLVFSSWSEIAALRVLQDAPHGINGREIARIAAMSHRSCHQALTQLEQLGIVRRVRGGRDHIFSLNRKHYLVNKGILPLLESERSFSEMIFDVLRQSFRKTAVSAIVFGSVARKDETPESDLDLCLIARTITEKNSLEYQARALAPRLLELYNVKLSAVVFTLADFRSKAKAVKPPVADIMTEGILLTGESIMGMLHGDTHKPKSRRKA
ncbi:MAG: nucleotidyltransferase domain-containing protein [Ignavibacteriales bacterium]|nr:nucleotidyltransferase domain-containing protein [Ignavibacteriales bacterium]